MIDLIIDPSSNDLSLNNRNEIEYYESREVPPNALIRLASTPETGYARMVRIGEQTVILNPNYHSVIPQYISSPSSSLDEMADEFVRLANYDGRILLENISLSATATNAAKFNITYRLTEDPSTTLSSIEASL